MSNKILLKSLVAFGILAMLLIFLGVNYVPRISALSSAKENVADAARYAGSDWTERHPSNYYSNSDWIERHPVDADIQSNEAQKKALEADPNRFLAENPEISLTRRYAAANADQEGALYKMLTENPELMVVRRFAK